MIPRGWKRFTKLQITIRAAIIGAVITGVFGIVIGLLPYILGEISKSANEPNYKPIWSLFRKEESIIILMKVKNLGLTDMAISTKPALLIIWTRTINSRDVYRAYLPIKDINGNYLQVNQIIKPNEDIRLILEIEPNSDLSKYIDKGLDVSFSLEKVDGDTVYREFPFSRDDFRKYPVEFAAQGKSAPR